MLPMVPVAFPVPSYASDAFLDETARWYRAVGRAAVAPALARGAHRAACRSTTRARSTSATASTTRTTTPTRSTRSASSCARSTGTCARCATRGATTTLTLRRRSSRRGASTRASVADLARHVDWTEFHEHLLSTAMERMAAALVDAGFDGLPTTHNLPLGESATPLNPARMTAIDLLGLDYYHRATPTEHWSILRRTTELACRCEGRGRPAFGAEVGAGFPPFFAPLDEHDSMYALIVRDGLRPARLQPVHGGRARPLDRRAHRSPRPAAPDGGRATAACSPRSTGPQLHTLRRRAPVRLVVPARAAPPGARDARLRAADAGALQRRRARAGARACSSATSASARRPSSRPRPTCAPSSARCTRAASPSPTPGGETVEHSTRAPAGSCARAAAGSSRTSSTACTRRARPGAVVTLGPRVPELDGAMRPLKRPLDVDGLRDRAARRPRPRRRAGRPPHRRARAADVAGRSRSTRTSTVHEDAQGAPRVVFVMNPTAQDLVVAGLARRDRGAGRRTRRRSRRRPRRHGRTNRRDRRRVRGEGPGAGRADAVRRGMTCSSTAPSTASSSSPRGPSSGCSRRSAARARALPRRRELRLLLLRHVGRGADEHGARSAPSAGRCCASAIIFVGSTLDFFVGRALGRVEKPARAQRAAPRRRSSTTWASSRSSSTGTSRADSLAAASPRRLGVT